MFVSRIVKVGLDLVLCVANLLGCYKYIVMFRSVHPKTQMTLAEYYYMHYSHLLVKHNIIVAELNPDMNPDKKALRIIGQD